MEPNNKLMHGFYHAQPFGINATKKCACPLWNRMLKRPIGKHPMGLYNWLIRQHTANLHRQEAHTNVGIDKSCPCAQR